MIVYLIAILYIYTYILYIQLQNKQNFLKECNTVVIKNVIDLNAVIGGILQRLAAVGVQRIQRRPELPASESSSNPDTCRS